MTYHPAFDVLSKFGIQPVTNSPDGTFRTNCPNPKCRKPNTNFVQYDDESVGWHCEACGDSRIVQLRPARAKTNGGDGASLDADEKRRAFEEQKKRDFPEDDETEKRKREQREREERERQEREEREKREREEREKRERKPATIAEAAQAYYERGWKPVPIDRNTKKASGKGWQKRPYDPRQFNGNAQNVGVQLGVVSGGLADVDLDCAEAIALAPKFLPPTDAIFGRKSKPASHRLYITDLCEAVVGAVMQFPEYVGGKADAMLVELRIGGKRKRKGKDENDGGGEDDGGGEYEYTGATSVFPPSVHTSGEIVAWVRDGEPAKVAGEELVRVMRKLAVAALLKRHYPGDGSRHAGALAIGGVLVRAGWDADDIGHVVDEAARAAGDDDIDDRITTAKGAVGANATGTDVAGLQSARETWGDIVADTLGHWLKVRKLRPDKGVGIEDRVALDFAAKHADDLRYIAKSSMWMHWSGNHWQEEPTTSFAYDEARKLCRPAGDARAKTVNAVTVHARADRRIAATGEQWNAERAVFNPKQAKE